jgi:hypothetical protein
MDLKARLVWPDKSERYTKPMIEFYDPSRAEEHGFGTQGELVAAVSAVELRGAPDALPFPLGRTTLQLTPEQLGELKRAVPWERVDAYEIERKHLQSLDRHEDVYEDEPSYEDGRALHRYDAYVDDDGSVSARVWTNDNLDTGYPSETASWEQRYRSFEDFARNVGPSHTGISGCLVEVTVNGNRFERGMTLADLSEVTIAETLRTRALALKL